MTTVDKCSPSMKDRNTARAQNSTLNSQLPPHRAHPRELPPKRQHETRHPRRVFTRRHVESSLDRRTTESHPSCVRELSQRCSNKVQIINFTFDASILTNPREPRTEPARVVVVVVERAALCESRVHALADARESFRIHVKTKRVQQ